jgi:hypothetical protein
VLIALSLAYVGLEDLWLGTAAAGTRARLTFVFGLVHGFGFASALREIGVPPERTVQALLAFNLGVELGQLLVVSLAVPLLSILRRSAALHRVALPALSVGLVVAGVGWAVTRSVAAASAHASALNADLITSHEESARSSYPSSPGALRPETRDLCAAFQEVPRVRRAQCAGRKPGVDFSGECRRMLNAALVSELVRLRPGSSAACLTAQLARHADCAVVSGDSVRVQECESIATGTVSEGKSCRSSLECASGLHCRGVSPIDTGTCRRPQPLGTPCGHAVDPLVAYLPHIDVARPECEGRCDKGRCTR